MTATTRYKYVKNTLGVPFTAVNFVNKQDGDDKQYKQVKRVLTSADIGSAAGQTQHANGCIIESLPDNYNVIDLNCWFKRPDTKIAEIGMIPFYSLDNAILGDDVTATYYLYGYSQIDNTIRVIDRTGGADGKLQAGDVIIALLTLGVPVDATDQMNTVNE